MRSSRREIERKKGEVVKKRRQRESMRNKGQKKKMAKEEEIYGDSASHPGAMVFDEMLS